MVVTRSEANKQMEEELAAIKSKLEDLDQKILGLQVQHSPMNNCRQPESSADTGSLLLVNFMDRSLIFLALMVMIQLHGYIRKNNISIYVTLLMSSKSHLHPFIWKMNPFNSFVGTSRLTQRQTGQSFSNSFCNDLALVLLMNSQEQSPNFTKLA